MANASNALFTWPADNLVMQLSAVVVDTGTEDPAYPILDGIQDNDPGKWGKFTTSTGSFVMDFGSPVSVEIFAMPFYHLTPGATVKIQANSSSSWGSPPLDVSITIPAYRQNGFPVGRLKDLSALTNTYQFWRWAVTAGNAQPVEIGWLWLCTPKRQVVQNVRWGLKKKDEKPQVTHETDFLWETHYSYGTSRVEIMGEIRTHQADGAEQQYQDWTDAAGQSQYFIFTIDPTAEDCRLMRHSQDYEIEYNYNDNAIPVRLLERSLGLRP